MYNDIGDYMKSIQSNLYASFEIKRSVFHTYCYSVHTINEVHATLDALKSKHPDANHHCYAYILEHQTIQKYEDDGEPSNTAGLPIMEALKRHDLTDVLCVVVRYFGGIKLGGGGLIRAYGKSASKTLENAAFTTLTAYMQFNIISPLSSGGKYEGFIREHTILKEVTYTNQAMIFSTEIKEADFLPFKQALVNYALGKVHIEQTGITHYFI